MNEKLFLVCSGCGEAFDTLEDAKQHEVTNRICDGELYEILPESQAM